MNPIPIPNNTATVTIAGISLVGTWTDSRSTEVYGRKMTFYRVEAPDLSALSDHLNDDAELWVCGAELEVTS